MQRPLPERLEVAARVLPSPVVAHEVVGRARGIAATGTRGKELVQGLAVVERRDQRLDDRRRAIVGAHIAPGFEIVRGGHVPMAEPRRLVVVEAEPDPQADLVEPLGEAQIRRRGDNRVRVADHEQIDLPRVHVVDELAQRRDLPAGGRARLRVHYRAPDVAERLVHHRREPVHCRRLRVTGDDETRAPMRREIARDGGDPRGLPLDARRRLRCTVFEAAGLVDAGHVERRRDAARQALDIARARRQPMIRDAARDRRHRLDDVEAIHRHAGLAVARGAELAHVADGRGAAGEKVGVEREDRLRRADAIVRLHLGTDGRAQAGGRAVARERIVLMPTRLRILGEKVAHLLDSRR